MKHLLFVRLTFATAAEVVTLVNGQTAANVYLPDSPANLFPNGTAVWPIIQRELHKLIDKISTGQFLPEHFPNIMDDYYPGRKGDHAAIVRLLTDEPRYIEQLPAMARLALSIHDVITNRPILLLHKRNFSSITLTQKEISVLLASAFFCEYPKREAPHSDFVGFPYPNFFGLFKDAVGYNLEKLKCFFNYFEQITKRSEPGTKLTFERRTLTASQIPSWRTSTKTMTPTVVTARGTIEDDGRGMLQVDFANKMIGGAILGSGAGQEEIRFSINPELVASLLFTEELADDEVLMITGSERFSNYTGYASTFAYAGQHVDTVPTDSLGRRQTQIVAMDALQFAENQKYLQFLMVNVHRDLNKAYSGFMFRGTFKTPIGTGKWGAGHFNGNPLAKFLIQLMVASEAERKLYVFTFGNQVEETEWTRIYERMVESDYRVSRIYEIFDLYSKEVEKYGVNAIQFETFVNEYVFFGLKI